MPSLENRYLPDENEVTAKVIDGEAIIINLLSGVYYSMEGTGAWIWEGIENGRSVGDICAAIAAGYGVEVTRVQNDVTALIDQLLQERMIRDAAGAPPAASGAATGAGVAPGTAYHPPVLNVYRDMAEVLALDPPTPGVFDSLLKDPNA
ncbi:MAG TPA: PqqD family protein [Candidatus Binatia bacterium]|nr:PqqD family protein [Candidatus Binatia bacterium]